uniref:Uncharacterized protein n=1 Tax=Lactuca sativa TaxID=4236 RepID=A0A9R1XSV1_LACSA|nr:hypothetical protein LSAT_V11C200071750 [Lactuca sativa]
MHSILIRGNVRELKDGDLELHVGDDTRVAVKTIGKYQLLLPNLILNNCCYVTSFRYKFDFDSENIYVFKENVFYFETSPNNGIYKINLNGSYQKDSSVYNITNKKTKLD